MRWNISCFITNYDKVFRVITHLQFFHVPFHSQFRLSCSVYICVYHLRIKYMTQNCHVVTFFFGMPPNCNILTTVRNQYIIISFTMYPFLPISSLCWDDSIEVLIDWLIDWLVFNVQRAIFQLYSGREQCNRSYMDHSSYIMLIMSCYTGFFNVRRG